MVKEKIINILKENPNDYISGEKISEELSVSRTAIWKHINALKEDGYTIESIPRKGYILKGAPDLLTEVEVQDGLTTFILGKEVLHFQTIDSTNDIAKQQALEGAEEGLVVIAEEQSQGRGRRGRQWISPKGTGIWMSVLLRPNIPPSKAPTFTLLAAVAVADAIIQETGLDIQIKWPNDLILNKKKICGILTEMNTEIDYVNYIIVGIGINVNAKVDEFEPDIKNKATSLFQEKGEIISRKNLVQKILKNLEKSYLEFNDREDFKHILQRWRELSCNIGNQVRARFEGKEIVGKAIDINEKGELMVEREDESVVTISFGEVSVRGLDDYV